MKKTILVTTFIAVMGLIGGTVVLKQQLHLSPEFHAQLVQLQKSVKAEQDDQHNRMAEHLAETEIETARLEEESAQLDVRMAELKGKSTASARKKLSEIQLELSRQEAVHNLGKNLDKMMNELGHEPSSEVVYAGLPRHAHTYRDYLVLKHFKSLEVANSEISACIFKGDTDKFDTKECRVFENQATKDQYYINAANDGKY